MTREITIQWMSFRDHGDEIIRLRRQVYVEEQGFGVDAVTRPRDPEGIHLGVFLKEKLVSTASAFVIENQEASLVERGLPPTALRVIEVGGRVSTPELRGIHVNNGVVAMFLRALYEVLRPEYIFFTLRGVHRALRSYYEHVLGFQVHSVHEGEDGAIVMIAPDEAGLRAMYLRARNLSEAAAEEMGLHAPSLVRFLEIEGRMDLIALEKLKRDNMYVAPLSLKDELPRLSAQTRVLFREQRSRIAATNFPRPPGRFLDLGAGPGVYLSMLSREAKLRKYHFVGLDEMSEMVTYARLNRPDIRWVRANAYDTGEPGQDFDVVHANFLFIHLFCPGAALREIHRILKPGGVFYLFETNDSTFEGPPALSRLIRSHCEIYLGNRRIMNSLPHLAKEHGFELCQSFSTRLRNTGSDPESEIRGDEMLMTRMTMWGLYSFLGQREELADELNAAQQVYFNSSCDISVCIQTHVYRKLER